jgi:hypothetical protein
VRGKEERGEAGKRSRSEGSQAVHVRLSGRGMHEGG